MLFVKLEALEESSNVVETFLYCCTVSQKFHFWFQISKLAKSLKNSQDKIDYFLADKKTLNFHA